MWVESEGIVWALGGYADLEDLKAVRVLCTIQYSGCFLFGLTSRIQTTSTSALFSSRCDRVMCVTSNNATWCMLSNNADMQVAVDEGQCLAFVPACECRLHITGLVL